MPDMSLDSPVRASSVSLAPIANLDGSQNGLAITARFKNTNWRHAGTEILLKIGNSNNYIYFQKRQSGYKFRWGIVSNGVIQLIDEFSVDYLYDGTFTIGASVRAGEIIFTMNGLTLSRQIDNVSLPDITAVDTVQIGQDFDTGQQANSNVIYDSVSIWDRGLTKTEIENATFESAPLDNISFDNNTWFLIKAGQSNSKADSDCVKPSAYDYTKPSNIKLLSKGMVLGAYTDPYTHLNDGNVFNAFNDVGGFSAAGVTLDRLAVQYSNKIFATTPCNMAGTGLVNETAAGKWDGTVGALATTGNSKRVSVYALTTYLTMLLAAQHGNLLAIEWYQGETDAQDGSTVTAQDYKDALTELFDSWKLILPPIRVLVGLSDQPSSGFLNWAVIQGAQESFAYEGLSFVSAQNLDVLTSEDYHLNGDGQKALGDLVADAIIAANV